MSLPTFIPHALTVNSLYQKHVPTISCCSHRTRTSNSISSSPTRRTFIKYLALISTLPSFQIQQALSEEQTNNISSLNARLQKALDKANEIDTLIDNAKWDSVRTALVAPVIISAKDASKQLVAAVPSDLGSAVVGFREDMLSAIRLLDTSVYSNVFIGEDRQILGTKLDYDTPRTYLLDFKAALEQLIDISSSS